MNIKALFFKLIILSCALLVLLAGTTPTQAADVNPSDPIMTAAVQRVTTVEIEPYQLLRPLSLISGNL